MRETVAQSVLAPQVRPPIGTLRPVDRVPHPCYALLALHRLLTHAAAGSRPAFPQLVALLDWPGLFAALGVAMLAAAATLMSAVQIEKDALKAAKAKKKA